MLLAFQLKGALGFAATLANGPILESITYSHLVSVRECAD